MGETTKIGWCDHTLNFWEGCTKVSPGCDNCYAAARDARFHRGAHWGPGAPRRERLLKACEEARRLNQKARDAGVRRRVFVNSLADFFDNEVPSVWRPYALGVMRACTNLDFLLLTKRIGNVRGLIEGWDFWPLANVWVGITVVTQEEADRDVPKLLKVPARMRFLSIEPQLEPIDLRKIHIPTPGRGVDYDALDAGAAAEAVAHHAAEGRIDWVICGGESGRKARHFDLAWARSLRDQCDTAGVPFFMKQVGPLPRVDDEHVIQPRDRAGADPAEWPKDLRIQQFPNRSTNQER